jgi:tRNA (guanine37-N1)-methyltransferase
MLMKVEPLQAAIQAARKKLPEAKVVYLSPQGKTINHQALKVMSQASEMIFLCGRYEGIDERLITLEVDETWSIGDYVLSGGELAAMVIVDAIARLLPNVLGNELSAEEDSFATGLLDHPHYTRPAKIAGLEVPKVLLSGNHAKITHWRLQQALGRTYNRRPDLLEKLSLTALEKKLLNDYIEKNVDVTKRTNNSCSDHKNGDIK